MATAKNRMTLLYRKIPLMPNLALDNLQSANRHCNVLYPSQHFDIENNDYEFEIATLPLISRWSLSSLVAALFLRFHDVEPMDHFAQLDRAENDPDPWIVCKYEPSTAVSAS